MAAYPAHVAPLNLRKRKVRYIAYHSYNLLRSLPLEIAVQRAEDGDAELDQRVFLDVPTPSFVILLAKSVSHKLRKSLEKERVRVLGDAVSSFLAPLETDYRECF